MSRATSAVPPRSAHRGTSRRIGIEAIAPTNDAMEKGAAWRAAPMARIANVASTRLRP